MRETAAHAEVSIKLVEVHAVEPHRRFERDAMNRFSHESTALPDE
jgi:hypothetical protein